MTRVAFAGLFGVLLGGAPFNGEHTITPRDDLTQPLPFDSDELTTIRQALSRSVDLDVERLPLTKTVADLAAQARVGIILDPPSLANAMVDRDQPISLHPGRVTLKTALDLILEPLNLVADVRPGVIVVVDQESVKKNLVRFHPVADLVLNGTGGWIDPEGRIVAQIIIDIVDRDLWEMNGGDGTIQFYRRSIALIINAPRETHEKVHHLLGLLRRSRAQTTALMERHDLGAIEDALVNTDRAATSPLGFYQPPAYPPAAKIHSLIGRYTELSETAGNAYSLAHRVEGELKQLRKELDDLRKQLKSTPDPVSRPEPVPAARPASFRENSSADDDF